MNLIRLKKPYKKYAVIFYYLPVRQKQHFRKKKVTPSSSFYGCKVHHHNYDLPCVIASANSTKIGNIIAFSHHKLIYHILAEARSWSY